MRTAGRPTHGPIRRLRGGGVGVALVALTLAGCGDGAVPDSIDVEALFAPPTAAERAAVEADWAGRSPVAADVAVELEQPFSAAGLSATVRVVSHVVDGTIRHYGAVLTPDSLSGPAPVIVYAHGGNEGVRVDDILTIAPLLGAEASRFIWVVPSFRSESLVFGDSAWTSEGAPSPWDRDVDDALALLDAALDLEALADPSRIAVLGFSRGGGVGLLMAAREPAIGRVVEFFGPTDFFGPPVREVFEQLLAGQGPDLAGIRDLDAELLQPLRRGMLTVPDVRLALLRRSPAYFAGRLPTVQVHHGRADAVVDVQHAEALIDAMADIGRSEPDFQAYLYDGGTHSPLTLVGALDRTVAFLVALLD